MLKGHRASASILCTQHAGVWVCVNNLLGLHMPQRLLVPRPVFDVVRLHLCAFVWLSVRLSVCLGDCVCFCMTGCFSQCVYAKVWVRRREWEIRKREYGCSGRFRLTAWRQSGHASAVSGKKGWGESNRYTTIVYHCRQKPKLTSAYTYTYSKVRRRRRKRSKGQRLKRKKEATINNEAYLYIGRPRKWRKYSKFADEERIYGEGGKAGKETVRVNELSASLKHPSKRFEIWTLWLQCQLHIHIWPIIKGIV